MHTGSRCVSDTNSVKKGQPWLISRSISVMGAVVKRRYLTTKLAALCALTVVMCCLAFYKLDPSINVFANFAQQTNFVIGRHARAWFPKEFDENATVAPEAVCKIPQLLADDPLIRPFLKEHGPLKCAPEKNWVYTTGDGRFYIDHDAQKEHGEIRCTYSRIDRRSDSDYAETEFGPYANGTPLNGDSFRAQCRAADGRRYDNLHVSVPYPNGSIAHRIKHFSRKLSQRSLDLNVFVYMMDSVSRINFIRKLPKFYAFLTETVQGHVMEGFNVVGDGTPWCVIPMLTGHFQTELYEARKRFSNGSHLDAWPLLFKNFTAAGYVTSYVEEQPWLSAFNYKLKGFDKAPVDHYLRTMLLATESHKSKHREYCMGDTPRSILWCDFWRELQIMYRPLGGRHFSVLFSSELSHDDYNTVQSLDEHWTRTFGDLYERNFLNDTLLVVMGDHGRRFGPVRQTQTGKLEEKLPFLAIVTPPSFRQRFPLSEANLRLNRHRLVTAFDLHETFVHLLDFKEDEGRGDLTRRGMSLFREVPAERTCAHAQIKAHFCSCLDWTELTDMADPIVTAAAQHVIDWFNDQTREVDGRCANLTLGKVVAARLLRPNEQLMAFKESIDIDNYVPDLTADKKVAAIVYQVRFVTEPGGGEWLASASYFLQPKKFSMSPDEISRLNSYNDQAQCVINTHQHLRTFCYCV